MRATEVWRFICFVLFSIGISSLITYLVRKLYHRYSKRKFLKYFNRTFDASFEILCNFFGMLEGSRVDSETFLINELKRQKLNVPKKFSAMYYCLSRAFLGEAQKHKEGLRTKDPATLEKVKRGVHGWVLDWYIRDFNVTSLHWVMFAVPIVVAASTFFPLVIYFYFPKVLLLMPLIWGLAGLALTVTTILLSYRDWHN